MAEDYYKILGISKNASADQIKGAYRELALKYHPDRNKDKNAEEKFKTINEAYAVLSDPQKRQQYDAYGPEGFGQRYTEEDIFRNFNFDDIMRQFQENIFTGGFEGMGDMFGQQQQQEQTGVNLYLSFDDIEMGMTREYQVQRYKNCDNCKGTGGEPGSKQVKCTTCDGKGRVHVQQSTPFGRFSMVTICSKCGGRGKTFEKVCRTCRGNGKVLVTEKFKVTAEPSGKRPEKDNKEGKKGRFFGVF
ncbi:MAG: DnaJ domain-containing protein [Candidatus Micrarchaeaceae archaeon]